MHLKHVLLTDMYYLSRSNGTKISQCKLCDSTFSSVFQLSDHIQDTHLNLLMLGVTPSPISYSITNELGWEMNIDDSETEKEVEEARKYICELCHAMYNRRYKLLQHQQADHYYDNIPHKCNVCCFKSSSNLVLNYHLKTQCMSTIKKFQCNKCKLRFMWKSNLENHEKLIHSGLYNCLVCKTDFPTQYDLKNHKDCKPTETIHHYKCSECGQEFKHKDRLVHHLKTHNPKVEGISDKHLCPFCGKKLSMAGNLAVHILRHTGEKPYECEVCKKGFARYADKKMHQLTHTQERAYNCSVCDRAFSRSYQVKTHMRIHTGEKPYKCTHCEKGFAQSNDLKVHIRRHTGEKPYPCGKCGQRFIEMKALKNHRKVHGH